MTDEQQAALDAIVRSAVARAPVGTALVAIGWSSVESARSERTFGGRFEDAAADVYLGARCRIGRDLMRLPLVVLEPSTEGRLAASLARFGEGPAVAWYAVSSVEAVAHGPVWDGPFGPEWRPSRVTNDPPLVLLVTARTATIDA